MRIDRKYYRIALVLALCVGLLAGPLGPWRAQGAQEPLALIVIADKAQIDLSKQESVLLQYQVQGGVAPYSLSIGVDVQLPDGTWKFGFGGTSNAIVGFSSFHPSEGVKLRYSFEVTDSAENVVEQSGMLDIVGNPPDTSPLPDTPAPGGDLSVVLNPAKLALTFGETWLPLSWQIKGGTPPYTMTTELEYDYNTTTGGSQFPVEKEVPAQGSGGVSMPTYFTTAQVSIMVMDAAYDSVWQQYTVTMHDPTPLSLSLAAAESALHPGDTAHVSWAVTGHRAPLFVDLLVYYSVDGRLAGGRTAATTATTLDYVLPENAREFFQLYATVRDADGRLVTGQLKVPLVDKNRLPGDANGDTQVNIDDLIALIDHLVGLSDINAPGNADINDDNSVDVKDAIALIGLVL